MITTEWNMDQTVIEDRVSIGTGATIRGVKLERGAAVGAGAVVVKNVAAGVTVVGNPAHPV